MLVSMCSMVYWSERYWGLGFIISMAEKHQKKSKTTERRGEKVRANLKQTRRYMRQTEKVKANREAHTRGSYDMWNKARRR